MPILTPPSGPTYTDGSPYVIVPKVINAAWDLGNTLKAEQSAKISAATAGFLDNLSAPTISSGVASGATVVEPAVSIPSSASTTDVMDVFDTKYLELVALLADKFTVFRSNFFPDENAAYTAAEDTLQAALASGNYIPATVQAQIFGDDQARIIGDKVRAQEAVIEQFAGRRFPLPPDAAASMVLQIEQKAQDDLAESSRKIAVLSVEQFRFVIDKTLALRQIAMDSAVKYITALASGPDMASKLVNVGYDAQSKLISAASQFYNSRIAAAELTNKVSQFNVSSSLEAASKNQASELSIVESRVKALLSEVDSLARMATAMFNNLHVSAGVSGSDSLSKTQDLTGT